VEVAHSHTDKQQRCLRGFSHINRYWDKLHQIHAAKILPGEYYVTLHDEAIVTVLGSCISACIRDRVFGIGGMNHFMLPDSEGKLDKRITAGSEATRYGNFAMEKLINDILKHGGRRENLEIKIFGGGQIIKDMHTLDIGQRNIEFVKDYIRTEGLSLLVDETGDVYPRKVYFFPASGKVRVKKLKSMHNNTVVERESKYRHRIIKEPVKGDIELF